MTTTETDLIQREGMNIVTQAEGLQVRDPDSFSLAGQIRQAGKRYLKRVAEFMDPMVAAGLKAHRTALAQKAKLEEPANQVEAILRPRVIAYEQEQQQNAREAQAAAERERRRLEEEARLEAALQAEAEGNSQEAERALTSPVAPIVFAPPPVVDLPKAAGTSFRDHWSAEVTDFLALVTAVASRQVPISVLQADQKVLDGMARALKGNLNLPGVKAVCERLSPVRG